MDNRTASYGNNLEFCTHYSIRGKGGRRGVVEAENKNDELGEPLFLTPFLFAVLRTLRSAVFRRLVSSSWRPLELAPEAAPLLPVHFPLAIDGNAGIVLRNILLLTQSRMNTREGILKVLYMREMIPCPGIIIDGDTKQNLRIA